MFPIPRRIPLRNGVCLLKILQNSIEHIIFEFFFALFLLNDNFPFDSNRLESTGTDK